MPPTQFQQVKEVIQWQRSRRKTALRFITRTGALASLCSSTMAGRSRQTTGTLRCLDRGYRVIAHDRRGHARSTQTVTGNEMNTYAADVHELVEKLDLRDAIHIGHSTGGGEVARYVARYGKGRVAKAVLISAVAPIMVKSEKNPGGLPIEVFDKIREGTANHRAQFYQDITLPFYGYNRPGATISQGVRDNWWRQGMMGGIKAQYDCIKAFSETDFTEDLKKIEVPTLVMYGRTIRSYLSQILARFPQSCLRMPRRGSIPACHTACPRPTRTRSTPICLPS